MADRKLKVPPYANQLRNQPRLLVLIGHQAAWTVARENLDRVDSRNTVVIPPDTKPGSFNWQCSLHKSVVVIELRDTGNAYRREVVRVLAVAGATEIFLLSASCKPADCIWFGDN